jgi:hypothetical protein
MRSYPFITNTILQCQWVALNSFGIVLGFDGLFHLDYIPAHIVSINVEIDNVITQ